MQTANIIQGTPEWRAHRSRHFNASDAPAMLGISQYKTRNELVRERATGLAEEIDTHTQRRFDDGHRFEALARPLAEKIIGKELSPLVGVADDGPYSASYDGITLMEDAAFEHKAMNDRLRGAMFDGCTGADLPDDYRAQMEHQCMVCPTVERVLFMASKWSDDDTLIEERHCWYTPDPALRQRIVAGWAQFQADVAAYVPAEVKEMPAAEVTIALPALFIHATGEITTSNMKEYGNALAERLAQVRAIQLLTDQDFVNAKESAKMLREYIKQAQQAKDAMLSQTVTVGEAARMIDAWCEDMRKTALQLEKDVEREDKAKKEAMIIKADESYQAHLGQFDSEILGLWGSLPSLLPDWAGAIKGKRSYANMQDALDTALANAKVSASQRAADLRDKLVWVNANAAEYRTLLPDLQQLALKPTDDFRMTILFRIDKHKKDEAERMEAERERIRKEEAEKLAAQTVEPAQAAPQTPDPSGTPTLRLGQINARLTPIALSADGLASLGFAHAATDKSAKLYHERDFPAICAALVRHIQTVQACQPPLQVA